MSSSISFCVHFNASSTHLSVYVYVFPVASELPGSRPLLVTDFVAYLHVLARMILGVVVRWLHES